MAEPEAAWWPPRPPCARWSASASPPSRPPSVAAAFSTLLPLRQSAVGPVASTEALWSCVDLRRGAGGAVPRPRQLHLLGADRLRGLPLRSSTTTTPRRSSPSTGRPRSTPSSTGTTSRSRSSTTGRAARGLRLGADHQRRVQSDAPPGFEPGARDRRLHPLAPGLGQTGAPVRRTLSSRSNPAPPSTAPSRERPRLSQVGRHRRDLPPRRRRWARPGARPRHHRRRRRGRRAGPLARPLGDLDQYASTQALRIRCPRCGPPSSARDAAPSIGGDPFHNGRCGQPALPRTRALLPGRHDRWWGRAAALRFEVSVERPPLDRAAARHREPCLPRHPRRPPTDRVTRPFERGRLRAPRRGLRALRRLVRGCPGTLPPRRSPASRPGAA